MGRGAAICLSKGQERSQFTSYHDITSQGLAYHVETRLTTLHYGREGIEGLQLSRRNFTWGGGGITARALSMSEAKEELQCGHKILYEDNDVSL